MATVSPDHSAPENVSLESDPSEDEIRSLVADTAPRLFAVVVTYEAEPGVRDACVAAWGMADDDGRTYLAASGGRTLGVLREPENALRLMALDDGDEARIVWAPTARVPANV